MNDLPPPAAIMNPPRWQEIIYPSLPDSGSTNAYGLFSSGSGWIFARAKESVRLCPQSRFDGRGSTSAPPSSFLFAQMTLFTRFDC